MVLACFYPVDGCPSTSEASNDRDDLGTAWIIDHYHPDRDFRRHALLLLLTEPLELKIELIWNTDLNNDFT